METKVIDEFSFFLSNVPGIGPRKAMELIGHFRTADSFFKTTEEELHKIKKLSKKDIGNILDHRKIWDQEKETEKLRNKNMRFIAKGEKEYPKCLRHIYDPPVGIYVKGKMPDNTLPCIAIVGARNCSQYGKVMAKAFSRKLSEMGMQVISGMARGIDGYAHAGALEGKTPSFAVLGNGADICYPVENIRVYEKLIERGGVLSEYPPGRKARPEYFPMRNRIISGIAEGVLIIEASEKSGSLITADTGLEQGKDIFALPGRTCDSLSKGSNNLIKMGAYLVDSPEDILNFYHINIPKKDKCFKKNNILLETTEEIVYAILRCEPKHLDEIIKEAKISSAKVLTTLISLECKGLCQQVRQNYFISIPG